jgi:hypothetical protein
MAGSETDQRSVAMAEVFAPAVSEFAELRAGYNATLFAQGTELEAISRGNLEMSIASAQELAQFFPEFSIFTAGYVHQDAAHQVAVFNDPLMDPFKQKVDRRAWREAAVGDVSRSPPREPAPVPRRAGRADARRSGRRQPADARHRCLAVPRRGLGASPTPMAFTEVYTALSTGAVDGQDNPLPTVVDAKFYEVTCQIALTSHLVDLNYIAFSEEVWDGLDADQQATVQRPPMTPPPGGRLRSSRRRPNLAPSSEEKGSSLRARISPPSAPMCRRKYVGSEFAETWPEGVLEQINALGN